MSQNTYEPDTEPVPTRADRILVDRTSQYEKALYGQNEKKFKFTDFVKKTKYNFKESFNLTQRSVFTNLLPNVDGSIGDFASNLAQEGGFNLSSFLTSSGLKGVTSQNAATFIAEGVLPSDYALRTATASATLGILKFQRNEQLTYMRKMLSLSYEQTQIQRETLLTLKGIGLGGIGGKDGWSGGFFSRVHEAWKRQVASATASTLREFLGLGIGKAYKWFTDKSHIKDVLTGALTTGEAMRLLKNSTLSPFHKTGDFFGRLHKGTKFAPFRWAQQVLHPLDPTGSKSQLKAGDTLFTKLGKKLYSKDNRFRKGVSTFADIYARNFGNYGSSMRLDGTYDTGASAEGALPGAVIEGGYASKSLFYQKSMLNYLEEIRNILYARPGNMTQSVKEGTQPLVAQLRRYGTEEEYQYELDKKKWEEEEKDREQRDLYISRLEKRDTYKDEELKGFLSTFWEKVKKNASPSTWSDRWQRLKDTWYHRWDVIKQRGWKKNLVELGKGIGLAGLTGLMLSDIVPGGLAMSLPIALAYQAITRSHTDEEIRNTKWLRNLKLAGRLTAAGTMFPKLGPLWGSLLGGSILGTTAWGYFHSGPKTKTELLAKKWDALGQLAGDAMLGDMVGHKTLGAILTAPFLAGRLKESYFKQDPDNQEEKRSVLQQAYDTYNLIAKRDKTREDYLKLVEEYEDRKEGMSDDEAIEAYKKKEDKRRREAILELEKYDAIRDKYADMDMNKPLEEKASLMNPLNWKSRAVDAWKYMRGRKGSMIQDWKALLMDKDDKRSLGLRLDDLHRSWLADYDNFKLLENKLTSPDLRKEEREAFISQRNDILAQLKQSHDTYQDLFGQAQKAGLRELDDEGYRSKDHLNISNLFNQEIKDKDAFNPFEESKKSFNPSFTPESVSSPVGEYSVPFSMGTGMPSKAGVIEISADLVNLYAHAQKKKKDSPPSNDDVEDKKREPILSKEVPPEEPTDIRDHKRWRDFVPPTQESTPIHVTSSGLASSNLQALSPEALLSNPALWKQFSGWSETKKENFLRQIDPSMSEAMMNSIMAFTSPEFTSAPQDKADVGKFNGVNAQINPTINSSQSQKQKDKKDSFDDELEDLAKDAVEGEVGWQLWKRLKKKIWPFGKKAAEETAEAVEADADLVPKKSLLRRAGGSLLGLGWGLTKSTVKYGLKAAKVLPGPLKLLGPALAIGSAAYGLSDIFGASPLSKRAYGESISPPTPEGKTREEMEKNLNKDVQEVIKKYPQFHLTPKKAREWILYQHPELNPDYYPSVSQYQPQQSPQTPSESMGHKLLRYGWDTAVLGTAGKVGFRLLGAYKAKQVLHAAKDAKELARLIEHRKMNLEASGKAGSFFGDALNTYREKKLARLQKGKFGAEVEKAIGEGKELAHVEKGAALLSDASLLRAGRGIAKIGKVIDPLMVGQWAALHYTKDKALRNTLETGNNTIGTLVSLAGPMAYASYMGVLNTAKDFMNPNRTHTKSKLARFMNTAVTAGEDAAAGFMVGGPWGALAGAMIGATAANADIIHKGLHEVKGKLESVGHTLKDVAYNTGVAAIAGLEKAGGWLKKKASALISKIIQKGKNYFEGKNGHSVFSNILKTVGGPLGWLASWGVDKFITPWANKIAQDSYEGSGGGWQSVFTSWGSMPQFQVQARPITRAQTQKNAIEGMKFLMKKGLCEDAAAALIGNFIQESSLNPYAVGDGGSAYGIAQWHPGRQQNIESHFGKSLSKMSFTEQLNAALWEMKTGYPSCWKIMNTKGLKVRKYVYWLVNDYERPAEREQNVIARTDNAYGVLKLIKTQHIQLPGKGSKPPVAANTDTPSSKGKPGKPGSPKSSGATLKVIPGGASVGTHIAKHLTAVDTPSLAQQAAIDPTNPVADPSTDSTVQALQKVKTLQAHVHQGPVQTPPLDQKGTSEAVKHGMSDTNSQLKELVKSSQQNTSLLGQLYEVLANPKKAEEDQNKSHPLTVINSPTSTNIHVHTGLQTLNTKVVKYARH